MRTFIFIVLAMPSACISQTGAWEYGADESGFARLVRVDSASGTAEELFLRAKKWVYDTYRSGDAVILFEDKASGLIECQGATKTIQGRNMGVLNDVGRFKYRMSIRLKDGRYRQEISDIKFEKIGPYWLDDGADYSAEYPANWRKGYPNSKKWWAELKQTAQSEFESIALSLTKSMNTAKATTDW